MKILILSPINPVQIIELGQWLNNYSQYNDIFSVQTMALLGENVLDYDYLTNNYVFACTVRDKPYLTKIRGQEPKQIQIFYGNLSKDSHIHFDHIIKFNTLDTEEFDPYLAQAEAERYEKTNIPARNRLTWYSPDDATIAVPTYHHLEVLLDTLGAKKNDRTEV